MSEPANCCTSDRLGKYFSTVQNGPEFRKLNSFQNENEQLKKDIRAFLFFHFWDLKLVTIDLALNSASGYLTQFFQNSRSGTKFETSGLNFSEMPFVIYSRKTRKCWNQNFFTGS